MPQLSFLFPSVLVKFRCFLPSPLPLCTSISCKAIILFAPVNKCFPEMCNLFVWVLKLVSHSLHIPCIHLIMANENSKQNDVMLYIKSSFFCSNRYTEDMELDDAVHTAILTLKEG